MCGQFFCGPCAQVQDQGASAIRASVGWRRRPGLVPWCLVLRGQTRTWYRNVRTTTTTKRFPQVGFLLLHCQRKLVGRHQRTCGMRRWECPPPQGSPAPSIAPSRPYDGGHGAGDGPPPQRSASEVKSGGRTERGRGARDARRSTETEGTTSGEAPCSLVGARGAGRGSHGRLRGCRGSSPGGADAAVPPSPSSWPRTSS